jgi:hypothetical protein
MTGSTTGADRAVPKVGTPRRDHTWYVTTGPDRAA